MAPSNNPVAWASSPHSIQTGPPIKLLATFALAICLLSTVAMACNIPVFRYALERWKPDACEVFVFCDASFDPKQNTELSQLVAQSQERRSNLSLTISPVGTDKRPQNVELWETIRKLPGVKLPYVVVRTSVSDKQAVNSWHGELAKFKAEHLLESPARRELSKRLLKGDSVVWVVLKSPKQDRNEQLTKLLNAELKKLAKETPFPDGLGLPGSELYAELPLLMQFTVLEIDPADPREQFLVGLFSGFEPEAIKNQQPLVVPVFGRGRALEVMPADRLDAGMIGDLTRYLCGACSCQVKERNPGFDLLLQADWDRELFGAAGALPPPPKEFDPNTAPTYVPIPKR